MRFKFSMISNRSPREADWRCCWCFHVRTGTILLGIWHVILHLMSLCVMAVVILHPEFMTQLKMAHKPTQSLANFSSLVEDDHVPHMTNMDIRQARDSRYHQELLNTKFNYFGPYTEFAKQHRENPDDVNVGMAITVCTFIVTLLMLYGAIKSKPSYLMPFFCLQVFDFFIASLTAIGYISYFPNIQGLIKDNPDLPFREELLRLDPELVSMVILAAFIFTMGIKAYFIGVVWSCYKYLIMQMAPPSTSLFNLTDSEALLPDYDVVIADKQAMFPTPPPSYDVAVANEEAAHAKEESDEETTAPPSAATPPADFNTHSHA